MLLTTSSKCALFSLVVDSFSKYEMTNRPGMCFQSSLAAGLWNVLQVAARAASDPDPSLQSRWLKFSGLGCTSSKIVKRISGTRRQACIVKVQKKVGNGCGSVFACFIRCAVEIEANSHMSCLRILCQRDRL